MAAASNDIYDDPRRNDPIRLLPEEVALLRQWPINGGTEALQLATDEQLVDCYEFMYHVCNHMKVHGEFYPLRVRGQRAIGFERSNYRIPSVEQTMAAACSLADMFEGALGNHSMSLGVATMLILPFHNMYFASLSSFGDAHAVYMQFRITKSAYATISAIAVATHQRMQPIFAPSRASDNTIPYPLKIVPPTYTAARNGVKNMTHTRQWLYPHVFDTSTVPHRAAIIETHLDAEISIPVYQRLMWLTEHFIIEQGDRQLDPNLDDDYDIDLEELAEPTGDGGDEMDTAGFFVSHL